MGAITIARAGTLAKPTAAPVFSPDDIAGLRAWFDADAITGKVDTDTISQWDDLSGNGLHATQATGANQPTYQTNEINGLPVVQFDGSNDSLGSALNNADASITVFLIGRFLSGAANVSRILSLSSDGAASIFNNGDSDYGYYANQGGSIVDLGGTPQTATILALVFASNSSTDAYRDGTLHTTFDPSNGYTGGLPLTLGAQRSTENFAKCQIGEVLIYDSALGSTDREAVEQYLGDKWGISV